MTLLKQQNYDIIAKVKFFRREQMKYLIRKILEENKINHTQFAKDMEISRSYAVSLLKGSKPFTASIYKKLITLDYIAGKDLQNVCEEYFKIKHGAKQFELVKYFLELGRSFTFEETVKVPLLAQTNINQSVPFLEKKDIIDMASALLHTAVTRGVKFYTNYSFTLSELDENLYAVYKDIYSTEACTIDHIIDLSNRIDKSSVLSYWQCLKWGALRAVTYVNSTSIQKQAMPYYIVCEDKLMLFSEDLSAGTFLVSDKTAQYYINCHLIAKEKSRPAISIIKDEAELLTGQDFVQPKYIKSLSTHISAMNFLDYDMLYRTTNENPHEIKDLLIKAYINYYSHTKSLNNLYVYYTHDTLEDFIKTGILYSVSEKYLHEFSVNDRITAIDNVIENGMYSVIKEDTADFFRGYDASSTDMCAITHFILTPSWCNDYEIYMCIDKNQYSDLNDFTQALFAYIDNGHVYTREESDFQLKQLQTTKAMYKS